jgi:hypothetical protein
MPASRPTDHGPAHRSLALLLEDLESARREVRTLRHACTDQRRLAAARQALLTAMECYAAALTERGLPTPWRLRDDLRLHRRVGTLPAAPGARR